MEVSHSKVPIPLDLDVNVLTRVKSIVEPEPYVPFSPSSPFPPSPLTNGPLPLPQKTQQAEQAKAEADYERFLQDIEEDEEMRSSLALFKNTQAVEQLALAKRFPTAETDAMVEDETDWEDDDEDFPQIDESELLDELMDGLAIDDDEELHDAEEEV